jgi:hypothetical protein
VQNNPSNKTKKRNYVAVKNCRSWAQLRRGNCQRRPCRVPPRLRRAASPRGPRNPAATEHEGRRPADTGTPSKLGSETRRSTTVRPGAAVLPSNDAAKTTRSTRPRGTRRASFFFSETNALLFSTLDCLATLHRHGHSPTVHHATRSERTSRCAATTSDKIPFFF